MFIDRPPATNKHYLPSLYSDDHMMKINTLICGPLSVDFMGIAFIYFIRLLKLKQMLIFDNIFQEIF